MIINTVCQLVNIEVRFIRQLYMLSFLLIRLFLFLKYITILISPIPLN